VAIERLASDAEFGAKLADVGAGLAHGGLSESKLRCGHLERPSSVTAAGASRREAGSGALDDKLTFEFGERGEDAENQTAVRGRGVQVDALPGQHFQAHAALGEIVDEVDEVSQVATEAVELPGNERVAGPQRLETGFQPGPIVPLAGGVIFVNLAGRNAGTEQSVPLEAQRLAAVRLAHAHVADLHRDLCSIYDRLRDTARRLPRNERICHLIGHFVYVPKTGVRQEYVSR